MGFKANNISACANFRAGYHQSNGYVWRKFKGTIRKKIKFVLYKHHTVPIVQLSKDDVKIKDWKSSLEASVKLNIYKNNISSVLNGRTKTAGGFKWKYKLKKWNLFGIKMRNSIFTQAMKPKLRRLSTEEHMELILNDFGAFLMSRQNGQMNKNRIAKIVMEFIDLKRKKKSTS